MSRIDDDIQAIVKLAQEREAAAEKTASDEAVPEHTPSDMVIGLRKLAADLRDGKDYGVTSQEVIETLSSVLGDA